MKTLTEFSGFVLKEAMAKKTALLAEGKSEEEVMTVIHEQLKLDESKTGFYKNVVDMTSSRIDRVKRVVVALKASETEKVPENYIEREGHFYLVEYFPDPNARPARSSHSDRDDRRGGPGRGRRDSRGESRGEGSRGDRPPRREGRPERAPRPEAAPRINDGSPGFISTGEGVAKPSRPERPKREPRAPRAPRAPAGPRAPRGPKGAGELRLVLKGQSGTTLAGSGQGASVATPEPTSEQPQA